MKNMKVEEILRQLPPVKFSFEDLKPAGRFKEWLFWAAIYLRDELDREKGALFLEKASQGHYMPWYGGKWYSDTWSGDPDPRSCVSQLFDFMSGEEIQDEGAYDIATNEDVIIYTKSYGNVELAWKAFIAAACLID